MVDSKSTRITASTCAIGIVTYLGRFETYFQPLIRRLHFLFPDYEINIFINGHHDICEQVRYLNKVTAFLQPYSQVRYLTHLRHQPLARAWNCLMLMSSRDRVLMLNDDVFPELEFRHRLEGLENPPDFCAINRSFSHFLISKAIIRRVGWFDERFLGIGHEDGDYLCRMASLGLAPEIIKLHGLINYVAPATKASWAKISEVVHGKYARVNFEIFKQKWWHSNYGPVPRPGSVKISYGDEEWTVAPNTALEPMPNFYPLECLDRGEAVPNRRTVGMNIAAIMARLLSFLHYLLREGKRGLGTGLRSLLGRHWDFLMERIQLSRHR